METQRSKKNDMNAALSKFCLALEQDRRRPEGRIRTSKHFREHFFKYDDKTFTDRVFVRLPGDVRGPILSAWGIRGPKMAARDTDEKVRQVVHDALVAGDLDDASFEEGVTAEIVVGYGELSEWWAFWRAPSSPLTKHALRKSLESAYDLGLFDAAWFFDNVGAKGKLRGTDAIAEGLSKAELTEWLRNVHTLGDGSPKGLLTALGWERIVARTSDEILTALLDAMARKVGLAVATDGAPGSPTRRSNDETTPAVVFDSPTSGQGNKTPPAGAVSSARTPLGEASASPPKASAPASAPKPSAPPSPPAKSVPPPLPHPAPKRASSGEGDEIADVLANIDAALSPSVSGSVPKPPPSVDVSVDAVELDAASGFDDEEEDQEETEFYVAEREADGAMPVSLRKVKPAR